jgi:hypothetical protein
MSGGGSTHRAGGVVLGPCPAGLLRPAPSGARTAAPWCGLESAHGSQPRPALGPGLAGQEPPGWTSRSGPPAFLAPGGTRTRGVARWAAGMPPRKRTRETQPPRWHPSGTGSAAAAPEHTRPCWPGRTLVGSFGAENKRDAEREGQMGGRAALAYRLASHASQVPDAAPAWFKEQLSPHLLSVQQEKSSGTDRRPAPGPRIAR